MLLLCCSVYRVLILTKMNNTKIMGNLESAKGEVKVADLDLSWEAEIRIKQLGAIQKFLLAEGRNNEDVNSELLALRSMDS